MDEPPGQSGDGTDLLTVGLLVFFVSLVGIVAALMILPALL